MWFVCHSKVIKMSIACARCGAPALVRARLIGSDLPPEPSCKRQPCLQQIGEDREGRAEMRQELAQLIAALRSVQFEQGVPVQMSARDLYESAQRSLHLLYQMQELVAPGTGQRPADTLVPNPRGLYAREELNVRTGAMEPAWLLRQFRAVRDAIDRLPNVEDFLPLNTAKPPMRNVDQVFEPLRTLLTRIQETIQSPHLTELVQRLDAHNAQLLQLLQTSDEQATIDRRQLIDYGFDVLRTVEEMLRAMPEQLAQTIGQQLTFAQARAGLIVLLQVTSKARDAAFHGTRSDLMQTWDVGRNAIEDWQQM